MTSGHRVTRFHRALVIIGSLVVAAVVWLSLLHCFYAPPRARRSKLLAEHLALLEDASAAGREASRMRRTNAEWDFMARSFVAWSLAEAAVSNPSERPRALRAIDQILADTLAAEREHGQPFFLMPYARRGPFVQKPARSLFIDGEIALTLALRRLLEDGPEYKKELTQRVQLITDRMQHAPVLSAESYPNECWSFCNSVALAALKASDILDGTNHGALIRAWLDVARTRLTEPDTGLIVSSYTFAGETLDGPEGSTIWLVAHMLRVLDPAFAEDQYLRARRHLRKRVLGFGFAREWPAGHRGSSDVDSGPVIPLLEVSAGASGMAFIGAASFHDRAFLDELGATLEFAAFPIEKDGKLSYAASNRVGDAVLLYSDSIGPLWDAIRDGRRP